MTAARKYATIFRINVLGSFVYRSNVIVGALFYCMFISVFFCLWTAIYRSGAVNGYTRTQMVWYVCVSELIIYASRTQIFGQMSNDIKTGEIAYPLTRPCSYILMQASSALGSSMFSMVVTACTGIILGFAYVGPIEGFRIETLPFALISIALGIALNLMISMALGLTAFKFEENRAFNFLYGKLVFMLGAFIPVEFLPEWLQGIVKCLPFSFVAWAPCRLTVAFSWDFFVYAVPMQLFWIAVATGAATLLYRNGIRSIQSHGG